ncbi:hypothetical protein WMY93_009161 [Mugilogobius chulae]|uniref:Uncharacterized protein n=1 Tax=Mugilogobius chulae TaxID=88201 RepID=A0AAW0PPI3_9GOBI
MPLSAYMSPHSQDALEDLGDALSDLEKKLCQHFRRLEIAGKRGRKVPVLLTPAMQEALDLLVSKREMCGVVPGNKYLFARPKACSYFRGSDCLRHFAKMCGAKNPESLTSTKLRKQTATLSQVLNLSNTELDQLADFLGHDVRVHRQFYRLPEGTLQLAKVSKILMALEQGRMAEFKGKGLDDITIDPEDHALQDSEDEDENQNIEEDLDAEMPDETNETSQPVTIETSSHPSLQAVQRPSRKGPSRTPTSARQTVVKRTWNPREFCQESGLRHPTVLPREWSTSSYSSAKRVVYVILQFCQESGLTSSYSSTKRVVDVIQQFCQESSLRHPTVLPREWSTSSYSSAKRVVYIILQFYQESVLPREWFTSSYTSAKRVVDVILQFCQENGRRHPTLLPREWSTSSYSSAKRVVYVILQFCQESGLTLSYSSAKRVVYVILHFCQESRRRHPTVLPREWSTSTYSSPKRVVYIILQLHHEERPTSSYSSNKKRVAYNFLVPLQRPSLPGKRAGHSVPEQMHIMEK